MYLQARDYAPFKIYFLFVQDITLDESTVHEIIKDIRYSYDLSRINSDIVADGSSGSASFENPSRGKEACSCDTYKAKR